MSDVLAAMYRGDRDEAERLAADRQLDVFEAAALGRTERLRELLDEEGGRANAFGADVNALSRNERIQTAAIHAAAAAGEESTRYELVKLVLEHGADPNLEQGGGFRAIDAARQNGDERLEQLLLEHGAHA